MSDSLVSGLPRILAFVAGGRNVSSVSPRYSLDNAATIMPPGIHGVSTSLFRLSVDMDEDIDPARLQLALDRTAKRFPFMAVELRRGFFWYHFVPCSHPIRVEEDPRSPCLGYNPNDRGTCLFRIRWRGNRIAGEFSHVVADGKGGMRFMKTLVSEYCRLAGNPALDPHPDVYDVSSTPSPEEYEDAYVRYYKPGLPHPKKGRPAFRIPGPLLPEEDYRITVGRIPLADALALARSKGVTLMELMAAVYIDALQSIYLASNPEDRKCKELAVEIPVDMRRFYPTATNRNFSLFTIIGEDMRLGPRDFETILARTKYKFRVENDESTIAMQITRNVYGMNHPAVRAIPLWLKDIGARILFSALGEKYVSGVVTNLGNVDLPKGVDEHILRFDLAQCPASSTKANVAIHSYDGEFYVTVCSLLSTTEPEELIFGRLESLGLKASLDCNLP
jgi:hypothetical protein